MRYNAFAPRATAHLRQVRQYVHAVDTAVRPKVQQYELPCQAAARPRGTREGQRAAVEPVGPAGEVGDGLQGGEGGRERGRGGGRRCSLPSGRVAC